ncbi:unnamed protein product [Calicophoron daubneyi]|uniref:Uncharacterized protein n=1 Tax=Calicophoron daubneyi TaxID=300641 RepID=A0AAV2TRX4_CALDB
MIVVVSVTIGRMADNGLTLFDVSQCRAPMKLSGEAESKFRRLLPIRHPQLSTVTEIQNNTHIRILLADIPSQVNPQTHLHSTYTLVNILYLRKSVGIFRTNIDPRSPSFADNPSVRNCW